MAVVGIRGTCWFPLGLLGAAVFAGACVLAEEPAPQAGATPAADSASAPDAAPASPAETVEITLAPRHEVVGPLVQYYRPMRVMLVEKPAEEAKESEPAEKPKEGEEPKAPETPKPAVDLEELKAEPEYRSEKPLYGVLELGTGEDRKITVVIDEPAEGEPRMFIDRNNDEDLTNDGPGTWDSGEKPVFRLDKVEIQVPYDGATAPYLFKFYRMPDRLGNAVLFFRDSCREGVIESAGHRCAIAVLDENSNGCFDDLDSDTLLIDLNEDGVLEGSPDSAEFHPAAKPFNVHGKVWEIASLSPDGLKLTLRPSTADVAMKPYLNPGCPAIPFSGKTLDDQEIDLAGLSKDAKVILVDFWASWCGPCRAEFPHFVRLHARFKNHGLRIIGINLDNDREKAVTAAKEAGLEWPHIFDGGGWQNGVAVLYRVHGIPQTYLIDPEGKIVAKDLRGEALEKQLRDLLGPGDEPPAEEPKESEEESKDAPPADAPAGDKQS